MNQSAAWQPVAIFRALLALGVLLHLLLVWWDFQWASDSSKVRIAMSWRGEGSLLTREYSAPLYFAFVVAWTATFLSLFFFLNYARYALGFLLTFGLLWGAMDGLDASFGLGTFLSSALNLIDGAVAALCFHPAISAKFSKSS